MTKKYLNEKIGSKIQELIDKFHALPEKNGMKDKNTMCWIKGRVAAYQDILWLIKEA